VNPEGVKNLIYKNEILRAAPSGWQPLLLILCLRLEIASPPPDCQSCSKGTLRMSSLIANHHGQFFQTVMLSPLLAKHPGRFNIWSWLVHPRFKSQSLSSHSLGSGSFPGRNITHTNSRSNLSNPDFLVQLMKSSFLLANPLFASP